MATENREFFREAQPSELAVFDLPPTQTAIENTYYQDVLPISQITSDSPVEFVISGQNGLELLDLQNCLIYVKAKITKGDGTSIAGDEDISTFFVQSSGRYSTGKDGCLYNQPLCLQGIHSKSTQVWERS